MIDLQATFEKYEDEYTVNGFDAIPEKFSQRRDLHAFILLDRLQPGGPLPNGRTEDRIIETAEHDQIWLAVDCERLAEVITEEQVRELKLCGVFYEDDYGRGYLSMYR